MSLNSLVQKRTDCNAVIIAIQKEAFARGASIKSYFLDATRKVFECEDPECQYRVVYRYFIQGIDEESVLVHTCKQKQCQTLMNDYIDSLVQRAFNSGDTSIKTIRSMFSSDMESPEELPKNSIRTIYNHLASLKAKENISNAGSWNLIEGYLARFSSMNGSDTLSEVIKVDGSIDKVFVKFPYNKIFENQPERLLFLDGCFIPSSYGGCILALCTIDPTRKIIPLSYLFCMSENSENVRFILDRNQGLLDDGTTIITDAGTSFDCIQDAYGVKHCLCSFHLLQNVSGDAKEMLEVLFTTDDVDVFKEQMRLLAKHHPKRAKLIESKKEKYFFFEGAPKRFGYRASSPIEALNAVIKASRKKNILDMMCDLIDTGYKAYTRVTSLVNTAMTYPSWLEVLFTQWENDESIIFSKRYSTKQVKCFYTINCFRTDGTTYYNVDTVGLKCSCGLAADYGYPCKHMVRAMGARRCLEIISGFWNPQSLKDITSIEFAEVPTNGITPSEVNVTPRVAAKPGRPKSRCKSFSELFYDSKRVNRTIKQQIENDENSLSETIGAAREINSEFIVLSSKVHEELGKIAKQVRNLKGRSNKSLTIAKENVELALGRIEIGELHQLKKRMSNVIRRLSIMERMKRFEASDIHPILESVTENRRIAMSEIADYELAHEALKRIESSQADARFFASFPGPSKTNPT